MSRRPTLTQQLAECQTRLRDAEQRASLWQQRARAAEESAYSSDRGRLSLLRKASNMLVASQATFRGIEAAAARIGGLPGIDAWRVLGLQDCINELDPIVRGAPL